MKLDDPRHGTYAGTQAHLNEDSTLCEPCAEARRRYNRELSYDHDRGRKRRIPRHLAAAHIHTLRRAGLSIATIAERAGVARGTIYRALDEGYYAGSDTLEATSVARIISVPIPTTPGENGYVPRIGVTRRIQALNAIGWPRTYIAARLGIASNNLTMLAADSPRPGRPNTSVTAATWHRVAALYAELCMTTGPSQRSRDIAARKGWLPPLAFDDIDDPDEQPTRPLGTVTADQRAALDDLGIGSPHVDPVVVERILAGDYKLPATPAERREVIARWPGSLAKLRRETGWNVHREQKAA